MHKIHIIEMIPFYNDTLEVIRNSDDNSGWIGVKAICAMLGMDHKTQLDKVKNDPRFNCRLMATVAADGKTREMLMLSIEDLHFFLSTINSNRLAPREGEDEASFGDRVEKLITYQRECGQALRDYWMNGAAINDRDPEDLMVINAELKNSYTQTRESLIHAVNEFAAYAASKGTFYDRDDIFHGCLNLISGHVIGRKFITETEKLSGAEQRLVSTYERLLANTLVHYATWDKEHLDIMKKLQIHLEAFCREHPAPLSDVNMVREDLYFASLEESLLNSNGEGSVEV